MPRYVIESDHDPAPDACLRMLGAFLQAGAHFLTNAEWGCMAGVHKAWIVVEAESDAEARLMVPPVIRNTVRLVKLNKFTPDMIRQLHTQHGLKPPS
ncbi:MAG: hypothetical protein EXR48_02405 [Dehalococcoidia bacterium]|nr:hypothetical protein [Dehalococcoidia bacterium]